MKKTPLLPKVVSLYVLLAFAGFIYSSLLLPSTKPAPAYHQISPIVTTADSEQRVVISGKPEKISIPRLNISLDISPGVYDERTDSWSLANNGAHFAHNTSLPNDDKGNTLIYGHNNPKIFGATRNLKAGDELFIKTDNKLEFKYIYREDIVVGPTDTSIFSTPENLEPRLTLLTCNGTWSQNRRLMSFDFKEVRYVQ